MMKRIGVLTTGGDAPGQNSCLKILVSLAVDAGLEVIGFRKGWEGLLRIDLDHPESQADNAMALTKARVRDIDRQAGSFLHSSRLVPGSVPMAELPPHLKPLSAQADTLDLTAHILKVAQHLDIDTFVLMGDSASLTYAARLSKEGLPIIAIPKTVHNDVAGSDYSLGFSTSLATGVRFVHEVRAMAGSREEIAVVEMFGRNFGLTTLLIGALSGADRVLIPETPFDPEQLAQLLAEDQRINPNNYAILVMSEAICFTPEKADRYLPAEREGNPSSFPFSVGSQRSIGAGAGGSGAFLTEVLENLLGQRLLYQPLSYLLRAGYPDGQDLLGAYNFASLAVDLLKAGKSGRLVAYRRGENYVDLPLETVTLGEGNINVGEHYDQRTYRAKPTLMWATRI
ncbi:MAG: 6-phosphofructokinase [Chloroflexota bacterium]